MKRRQTEDEKKQSHAHDLLQEWASGPPEGPAEDGSHKDRVHGGVVKWTAPERYAVAYARWDTLDRAVRQVAQTSRTLGRILHRHYGMGYGEQRCADLEKIALRTWRAKLHQARFAFLIAYDMSRQPEKREAQDVVREAGV